MKPTTIYALRRYLESIRNPAKRTYGAQYLSYLRGSGRQPVRGDLSAMAAQAVEMRVRELMAA